MLYVIYSTENSFVRDECGRVEFIGMYDELDKATENKNRISNHHELYVKIRRNSNYRLSKKERREIRKLEKEFDENSVKLVENGEEYSLSTDWHGYFESVCEIEIQPMMVLK